MLTLLKWNKDTTQYSSKCFGNKIIIIIIDCKSYSVNDQAVYTL